LRKNSTGKALERLRKEGKNVGRGSRIVECFRGCGRKGGIL
jgi:hypothetical protein